MSLIVVVSKFIYLSLFTITLPTIYCEHVDFKKNSQNDFQSLPYNIRDGLINAIPKAMEGKIVKELINSNKENKVLVKRIVPHNKPFKMEYDDKFNILYKPLIRIHKSNQNSNSIEGNYLIMISPSFQTKHKLLKISKMSTISRELTKKIHKRNKIYKIHQKLVDFVNNVLRSPQSEKSGEDSDQLVPEKKFQPDELETKSEKPRMWLPHYPPWNFWTYKKTLYQDVCSENQVKIENMCVQIPPH